MNLNLTIEPIYSCDLDITGMTDYGVQMPDILGGKTPIPPQGARFDVAFAGRATGRLSGAVRGVDYLVMRADGRIALAADGVAVPQPGAPVVSLRENARLTTAAEKYAWVNARQIWAVGTVNLAIGKIHIDAFQQ